MSDHFWCCVCCVLRTRQRERYSVVSRVVGRNDANYVGESSSISNYMSGQNGQLLRAEKPGPGRDGEPAAATVPRPARVIILNGEWPNKF